MKISLLLLISTEAEEQVPGGCRYLPAQQPHAVGTSCLKSDFGRCRGNGSASTNIISAKCLRWQREKHAKNKIDGKKKIDGKQYAKKCSAEEDV